MTIFRKKASEMETKAALPDEYFAALEKRTGSAAVESRNQKILDLASGVVEIAGDLQSVRRSRAMLRQECDRREITFPNDATADSLRELLRRNVTAQQWLEGERAFDDLIAKIRTRSQQRAIPFSAGVTF